MIPRFAKAQASALRSLYAPGSLAGYIAAAALSLAFIAISIRLEASDFAQATPLLAAVAVVTAAVAAGPAAAIATASICVPAAMFLLPPSNSFGVASPASAAELSLGVVTSLALTYYLARLKSRPNTSHLQPPLMRVRASASTARTHAASTVRFDQPTSPLPEPVFVIGAPRSGTSILGWALGQHPNILALEETGWLGPLAIDLRCAFERGSARGERSHLSSMGVTRDAFFAEFGLAIDRVVAGHLNRYIQLSTVPQTYRTLRLMRSANDPKSRWVDSTPENSFFVYELARLFPAARFIHITRDVGQVVQSLMTFPARLVNTESEAYDYWLRAVRSCLKAEANLAHHAFLRINYDQLVADPQGTLNKCFSFLSEPFCEASVEVLDERINASPGARDYSLGTGGPDERLVESAQQLSQALLAHSPQVFSLFRMQGVDLESEFNTRIPVPPLARQIDTGGASGARVRRHRTPHDG